MYIRTTAIKMGVAKGAASEQSEKDARLMYKESRGQISPLVF
jgi:hypothetical protein